MIAAAAATRRVMVPTSLAADKAAGSAFSSPIPENPDYPVIRPNRTYETHP